MSVRCPGHTNSCYKRYKLLHAGGSGVRLYDGTDIKLFILVGLDRRFLSVAWPRHDVTSVKTCFLKAL